MIELVTQHLDDASEQRIPPHVSHTARILINHAYCKSLRSNPCHDLAGQAESPWLVTIEKCLAYLGDLTPDRCCSERHNRKFRIRGRGNAFKGVEFGRRSTRLVRGQTRPRCARPFRKLRLRETGPIPNVPHQRHGRSVSS
jgi:hypothetical protein